VASKFVWLIQKRGLLLVISVVAALVSAKVGGGKGSLTGFWDGPN
jgi:hypothetical protein